MRSVWKYDVPVAGGATLLIPKGGTIRHVGVQRPRLITIWVEVDLDYQDDTEPRQFDAYGTGHIVDDEMSYCGTVFDGPFVWHLYERGVRTRSGRVVPTAEVERYADEAEALGPTVVRLDPRAKLGVMMACGHAANATTTIDVDGKPEKIACCAICAGIGRTKEEKLRAYTPGVTPDLTGRTALCSYFAQCGHEVPSHLNLAFFEHRPDDEHDHYYCSCKGWD